jgi:hypothetical protein
MSVRSRTLVAGTACSGPGRRATADIGSSSEQHSSSKIEGRIIHSPQRIQVYCMNGLHAIKRQKQSALKRWQRAKDWLNDGSDTTQTSSRH